MKKIPYNYKAIYIYILNYSTKITVIQTMLDQ